MLPKFPSCDDCEAFRDMIFCKQKRLDFLDCPKDVWAINTKKALTQRMFELWGNMVREVIETDRCS